MSTSTENGTAPNQITLDENAGSLEFNLLKKKRM